MIYCSRCQVNPTDSTTGLCTRCSVTPQMTVIGVTTPLYCPSCAALQEKLDAINARIEDTEGMARALYLSTEGLDSEFGRWAATFDELKEEGRKMWMKSALAVQGYLKGEG